jgi:two-component system sensor histidine kinase TctE
MSLRTRLLLGILLPLAAILALGAWGLYRNALASAQAAFDRQLVSAAHSIADTLRLEGQRLSVSVPYAVLELHAPEPGGVFFHRVTGLEGELLAGDETLPRYRGPVPSAPGYTGLVGLYDDQVRDTPVRVAVVYQPVEGHERTGVVPVQVAEPLSNRERMAQALLWQTLATQLALLLAVALVTVLAVNHALRPLRRLRTELDQRDGQALAPLPEGGAGAELLPVVRALNALMARVRDMLGQQQRFVADAAHQLRTPLAVLQTQLQSGQGGAVEATVLMREMQGTVQRATALSQQLLSLARVQQLRGGAYSGGPEAACPLGAATREAALELSPLIAQQDLAFSLEVPGADVPAAIHPWLAGELIRNLLHNAIRHSPRGAALGVLVQAGKEPGLPVQWICWDQGAGIEPALRERVFEPFAQTGAATPAGHAPGSGLGLSICRAIVMSCGGQICLDDNTPGQDGRPGLRVTLQLPAAAPGSA